MRTPHQKSEAIEELLSAIREMFGGDSIRPYGDSEDPQYVGFRIEGLQATFSVLLEDRLPEGRYNIQIESYPDQFAYNFHGKVSLWDFLELAKAMAGPKELRPQIKGPTRRSPEVIPVDDPPEGQNGSCG